MSDHSTPAGDAAPDSPDRHTLAIQEAAAAICPAGHRRHGDPAEPPCGLCFATAESAIAAYLDAVKAAPEPGAP